MEHAKANNGEYHGKTRKIAGQHGGFCLWQVSKRAAELWRGTWLSASVWGEF